MSRRRAVECPTPSKVPYLTDDEAADEGARVEALLDLVRRPYDPFYVYLCPCRRWHLTHHRYDRQQQPDGTTRNMGLHRKARP